MSKNALALVDCNVRDVLFQYIIETFDRKATKNEMVSPYDDQLIGKMNFRHGGMEHSMFFTYAKANEYPGKRFRNRKIMYLSLGVNEISSDIFNQICATFGGFVDYNDDLEDGWQKIERIKVEDDPWQKAMAEANAREKEALDLRPELRQLLRMDAEDDEDDLPRENPKEAQGQKDGQGQKENRRKEHHRPERKKNGSHEKGEKPERAEKTEPKQEGKGGQKQDAKADVKAERKEDRKEERKEERKEPRKDEPKDERKEDRKDDKPEQQRRPRHHRGHRPRGPRKEGQKDAPKQADGKPEAKNEAKQINRQEKPAGSSAQ